jgi:E3 ubiquitin-protein ligase HUWE1
MVSYKEIEEFVYGSKYIDVDLLRRNTKYADAYKDQSMPQIEWFWKLLRSMSQEQRREFIRFCYAQPTIPPNDAEFRRRELSFKI